MAIPAQVNFRTTPEKRDAIRRRASAAGLSVAAFLEGLALDDSPIVVPEVVGRFDRCEAAVISAMRWMRRAKPVDGPFWHGVAQVFGLGTTAAEELCRAFGFDPESGEEA